MDTVCVGLLKGSTPSSVLGGYSWRCSEHYVAPGIEPGCLTCKACTHPLPPNCSNFWSLRLQR